MVTDHLALKWLNTIENPTERIARCALELQQYQFGDHYRKGNQNVVADALPRQPAAAPCQFVEESPGCLWLRRRKEEVQKDPEKYPNYTIQNGQLYLHIGLKQDGEESPRSCVYSPSRDTECCRSATMA